jgi:hypothetical protein
MKISPAVYPHPGVSVGGVYREKSVGLELRDYFAAHAMQGLISRDNYSFVNIAHDVYKIADAMLEERER